MEKENMSQLIGDLNNEIEKNKDKIIKFMEEDEEFAKLVRKLEKQMGKLCDRNILEKIINIGKGFVWIIIWIIIGIIISVYVYTMAPGPHTPEIPEPVNNSVDVHLSQSLSWIGGNQNSKLLDIFVRLFGKDLNPEITYYIYLDTTPENLTLIGIEVGDHKRDRIKHIPMTNFEQDNTYYWRVDVINSFNRMSTGPVWRFDSKRSPIIDIQNGTRYRDDLGSIVNTENDIGLSGNAINISYDLKERGFVGIYRNIRQNELIGTQGIKFTYKGGGIPNTLELKMVYDDSEGQDTTFQKMYPSATVTDGWINESVRYDEIPCVWPSEQCQRYPEGLDINKVKTIDFAISNKPEYGDQFGSGWVVLDEVRGIIV